MALLSPQITVNEGNHFGEGMVHLFGSRFLLHKATTVYLMLFANNAANPITTYSVNTQPRCFLAKKGDKHSRWLHITLEYGHGKYMFADVSDQRTYMITYFNDRNAIIASDETFDRRGTSDHVYVKKLLTGFYLQEKELKPGFVYVLKNGSVYKIGYSKNPYRRADQIKPYDKKHPVELIHVIPTNDMLWLERLMHWRFADYGTWQREWFNLNEWDVRIIMSIKEGVNPFYHLYEGWDGDVLVSSELSEVQS